MLTMCCNQDEFKIDELKQFSKKTGMRIIIRGYGEILDGEFNEWRHKDVLSRYNIH